MVTYYRSTPSHYHWGNGLKVCPSGTIYTYGLNWDSAESHAVHAVQDTAPLVNLPLSIAEMKDIPVAMRRNADNLRKQVASADGYLTYQWAIRPMMSDMLALLSLQRDIAARMRRHRKKFTTKRASGKFPGIYYLISSGSASFQHEMAWGCYLTFDQDVEITKNEGWFSARLEPQVALNKLLEETTDVRFQLGLAQTGARGLNTAYQLMPWSWLADYFSNLGDAIEYGTNTMPYKVTSVCLMAEAEITWNVRPRWPTWGYYYTYSRSDGKQVEVSKRRKVVTNPSGKWVIEPLLSGTQVANLAALAVSMNSNHGRRGPR